MHTLSLEPFKRRGFHEGIPGSELAWAGVYVPQPSQEQLMSGMIPTGTLKYLAYEPTRPRATRWPT